MSSYNIETAQIIDADPNLHEYLTGDFVRILNLDERGFVVAGANIAPASFDVQEIPDGLILNWTVAGRDGQETEQVKLDNDDDLRYALCERLGPLASSAYPTVDELCAMMGELAGAGWAFRAEGGWIHAEHDGQRSALEAGPVYWEDLHADADQRLMATMEVALRYRDDTTWRKTYDFHTAQDAAETIGHLLVADLTDDGQAA